MHKRQRKQLSPAFSFRHVKDLVPIFWSHSTALVRAMQSLQEKTGKIIVKPNVWSSRSTLDIIGHAGLGNNLDSLTNPDQKLARAYSNLFELDTTVSIFMRLSEFIVPAALLEHLP